jgi:integrase
MAKLTAKGVEKEKRLGYHGDGDGLWLQVTATPDYDPADPQAKHTAKSWILRYRFGDRQREMGLGSAKLLSLAEARAEARKYLKMARIDGVDPIEERRNARAARAVERAKLVTFRQAAEIYIAAKAPGWKNAKTPAQWTSSLTKSAYPLIGDLPVKDIDTGLVMQVLEPIWPVTPESASRVRQRIESVLDWAKVRGHRDGENPARWKGHLEHQLTPRAKMAPVKNHRSLPFAEMNAFWAKLNSRRGITAEALKFTILTAARTGMVLGAKWQEIDFTAKSWTVPAERMKGLKERPKEHRAVLSDLAIDVLKKVYEFRKDDESYIFPNMDTRKPLSTNSLRNLLIKMDYGHVSAHGFRATFSTWGSETTDYPQEMIEMALSHAIANKVEAAYRRGDMFEKRRKLMDDWAMWCMTRSEDVKVLSKEKGAEHVGK